MIELGLALSIFGAVLGFCPWSSEPFVATKLALVLTGAAISLGSLCIRPKQELGSQSVPLLTWAYIILSTTLFSCDPLVSLIGLGDSSQGSFISFMALGLSLSAAQMSGLSARRLATHVLAACCICAAYSVLQRLGQDPLFAGYQTYFGGRSFSTMGGPVLLAPVLAAALALAVGHGEWAASALILVGLLATGTRAAIGGGLAGAALAAYLSGRVSSATASRFAGLAIFAAVLSRASALGSDLGRVSLWAMAWQGFLDRPFAGWGANTFGVAMRQYIGADYLSVHGPLLTHSHAHNLVLQTLFSYGLMGVVGLLVTVLFGTWLWVSRRREDAPALGAVAAVLICAQTNPVPLAGWLVGLVGLAPLVGSLSSRCRLPARATYAAAALACGLLLVQSRLVRAEMETKAGRVAWNQRKGLEAANHFNKAARLNPWSCDVIAAQLDSSRNLVPWMSQEQAEQTAKDGLRIAKRLVKSHPSDARAHEALSAQFSLMALLSSGQEHREMLAQATAAIKKAKDLAPTFTPIAARMSVIAGRGEL